MKKRIIIITGLFVLGVLAFQVLLLTALTNLERTDQTRVIGRDTVKQWDNGSFQILRSTSDYSFDSLAYGIHLNDIKDYYSDNSKIFLRGNNNFYACVKIINGDVETHRSIGEFSDEDQLVFNEKTFIELPQTGTRRNIWDILFGK